MLSANEILMNEHRCVERFLCVLDVAVQVHTNDGGSPDALTAKANDFASIVRRHIANEDRALFPIAESILSDKERRQLAQQFERLNNEGAPQGRAKHYRLMLHDMEREMVFPGQPM